jgi:hypothetical protein
MYLYVNYSYVISFYTSDIYSLMMANMWPKNIAAIYNCTVKLCILLRIEITSSNRSGRAVRQVR